MKRLFVLALVPGMILGSGLRADELIFQSFFGGDSTSAECCRQPIPLQVPCETPVCVAPTLRTVQRCVPRTTYQTVTKTIMVPCTSLETRESQSVEYRDEVRQRVSTVYDQVPETRQVTTQKTVMVPETRQRVETFTVQVPTVRSVPQCVTVQNVVTETRIGTRRITRCVPGTELRTVTTGGEIVRRGVDSDLGGVKVQSNVVGGCTQQVSVPVMRTQVVEQTVAYDVQVTRPVTTTRMIEQTDYRTETRTRCVPEVVQVARVQAQTHDVTEMKSVPRQVTESYTERVPHVVTKTVQVPVTKMVAQTVTEQIPVTTYHVIEETVCE